MSVYRHELPKAFPYLFAGNQPEVRAYIRQLISVNRPDVPQGSSFAVTVDNWGGTWNLWLSKVSCEFLKTLPGDLSRFKENNKDY